MSFEGCVALRCEAREANAGEYQIDVASIVNSLRNQCGNWNDIARFNVKPCFAVHFHTAKPTLNNVPLVHVQCVKLSDNTGFDTRLRQRKSLYLGGINKFANEAAFAKPLFLFVRLSNF